MPFSLATAVHSELTIKKSRFIGCVQPCTDRAQALASVAKLRAEHPGAVHVCWALMAGGQSAANDDGEPSGTAGRPMLEVLRYQDLDGVLATVVRYWGGVKLGAGGLVRAYTDAVAQALLGAHKVAQVRLQLLRCTLPYAFEGLVRREIDLAAARLQAIEHGDRVCMALSLSEDQASGFRSRLTDLCQGQIRWLDKD